MEKFKSKNKPNILIADDSEMNRAILSDMLEDEYSILEAENGLEAIKILQEHFAEIDLLLLDIVMPELDGFEVLKFMNTHNWIEEIPVIIISSENASSFVQKAYELGVSDYINRPFDAFIVHKRVANTIMLYAKQKRLVGLVAEQIYEHEKSNSMMVNILSHIVEFRNGESGSHVIHISTITEILLNELLRLSDKYVFTQSDIKLISLASALHDIGKIAIDEKILNKPGRLTAEEFEIMKTHTTIGAKTLKAIKPYSDEPLVKYAYDICRWHHERYNGGGYPDGLVGDQIPIWAQIVALADVYDALTSERCYKKAFSHEKAMRMIINGESGVFNPLLLECLIVCGDEIKKTIEESDKGGITENKSNVVSDVLTEMLNTEEGGEHVEAFQTLEEERLKASFFSSNDDEIQFEYDSELDIVSLSNYGASKLGLDKVISNPHLIFISSLGSENYRRLFDAVRSTTPDEPEVEFVTLISVEGELRWHRLAARTLWTTNEEPKYKGVVGKLYDIHDRSLFREAEDFEMSLSQTELKEMMGQLEKVFDSVRLVDIANCRKTGRESDKDKPKEKCISKVGGGRSCANCLCCMAYDRQHQMTKIEFSDSKLYYVIAKYIEVEGYGCVLELVYTVEEELMLSASGTDTEKLAEKILRYNKTAQVDSLTGAYNRRYYDEKAHKLMGIEGVVMLDLDDFKDINDVYGHAAGDAALKCFADTVKSCVRTTDMLIRYGGDEFLLLFPKMKLGAFEEKLDVLSNAIKNAVVKNYPDIKLSASIGGVHSVYPVARAVKKADKLMYDVKRTSKGKWLVSLGRRSG